MGNACTVRERMEQSGILPQRKKQKFEDVEPFDEKVESSVHLKRALNAMSGTLKRAATPTTGNSAPNPTPTTSSQIPTTGNSTTGNSTPPTGNCNEQTITSKASNVMSSCGCWEGLVTMKSMGKDRTGKPMNKQPVEEKAMDASLTSQPVDERIMGA